MKLMRYVHKMRQLASAPEDHTQLPLELREREIAAPVPPTARRSAKKPDLS